MKVAKVNARSAIGEAVPNPNDVFTTLRIATAKSGSSGALAIVRLFLWCYRSQWELIG